MSKDLTILPVELPEGLDELEPKWKNLDPRLPKPPFVMVFNAGVANGKTTTIMNLLYNPSFYRELFDSIIVMSPTIENDLTWHTALQDDTVSVVTGDKLDQTDDIIDAIFKLKTREVQEAEQNGETPKQTLLILDDMLGMLGKKFDNMITRHRHPRISIMVTTQEFRALPPKVRTNASHYLIFRTQNQKELAKIVEEFANNYGIEKFLECYEKCTQERYSFMTLHQRTKQIYKKFDQLVYDAHENDVA